MLIRKNNIRSRRGMSLTEVMAATAILAVLVLGTSGYRYYAALDERKADMKIDAADIAPLLCESWVGIKGVTTYDPAAYFSPNLTITKLTVSATYTPTGFTLLGAYKIVANGANYYAVLAWKDISTDLRALNVMVVWSEQDPATSDITKMNKTFKLTTYVLK